MFVTPDSLIQSPFDPQTLNRYTYCRNNPLIYTDPSGHSFGEETPGGKVDSINGKGPVRDGSWNDLGKAAEKSWEAYKEQIKNQVSIRFNRRTGTILVTVGLNSYTMKATSGKGPSTNNPEDQCKVNTGPIPEGDYVMDPSKLTDPNYVKDVLRNLLGDWGDWRVELVPEDGTKTCNRKGFFMHGGRKPGSAGCIDIGGGLFGNEESDRLKNDILRDPDKVSVKVL
jgi:hypothetical protein